MGSSDSVVITGKVRGVCCDPNDDIILECASKSGAEVIVSGDKDLMALKHYKSTQIMTGRKYIETSAKE